MRLPRPQLVKRSFTIQGHRTSVALEPIFWQEFDRAAAERGLRPTHLVVEIDEARTTPLASALRVYLVGRLRQQLEAREQG